ncbi:hypothetical protein ABW21_db0203796 [Orbilia brochopaga]|nr:hypothetical protein ABW21_db0203796 [Drechslerella brochopaga]
MSQNNDRPSTPHPAREARAARRRARIELRDLRHRERMCAEFAALVQVIDDISALVDNIDDLQEQLAAERAEMRQLREDILDLSALLESSDSDSA